MNIGRLQERVGSSVKSLETLCGMGRDERATRGYICEKEYAGLHLKVEDEVRCANVHCFGELKLVAARRSKCQTGTTE